MKRKVQRGWWASHARHLGMFVGGILVDHGVIAFRFGNLHLDGIEEADELLMAVAHVR